MIEQSKESKEYLDKVRENLEKFKLVREQIEKVIVGQREIIDLTLVAFLCEGHLLLEGVPGLGKTILVKTLADSLNLQFSRIQFTPDLMPADVTGTGIAAQNKRGDFDLKFEKGPVFANLILADEINRASPKTQSSLLEAMQEKTVTVRGEKHLLPDPFMVLATQNPLEMEGTYPLPEAQLDRFFFKLLIHHPSEKELMEIMERTVGTESPHAHPVMEKDDIMTLQKSVREVVAPALVINYAARMVLATQPENEYAGEKVKKYIRYGAGPRGVQALILASKAQALIKGRFNISIDDIQNLAYPSLRHRIALNFDGQSEGIGIDEILNDVIMNLPVEVKIQEFLKV